MDDAIILRIGLGVLVALGGWFVQLFLHITKLQRQQVIARDHLQTLQERLGRLEEHVVALSRDTRGLSQSNIPPPPPPDPPPARTRRSRARTGSPPRPRRRLDMP